MAAFGVFFVCIQYCMIVSSLQTLKSVGCVFVLFLSVYIQYCMIVFSFQTLKRVGCVGVFFVCVHTVFTLPYTFCLLFETSGKRGGKLTGLHTKMEFCYGRAVIGAN